ncbi:MAG: hypothetical protein LBM99_00980 [Bacillales bacterium]|nr:hypothetical protein [Bacillales bacterium]
MKTLRKIIIGSLLFVVGCSSSSNSDFAVKYKGSVSSDLTPIDFKEESLDFVMEVSKQLLLENKNSVYSPTTDYLCFLTALLGNKNSDKTIKELGFDSFAELEEVYPRYFEGLNYQSENTSIKSISSLALVDLANYNDDTLKTFADKYKISSLLTSPSKVVKDVEEYYNKEIGLTIKLDDVLGNLEPGTLVALSGLTLKDSFKEEKHEVNKPFTNLDGVTKDVKSLSDIGPVDYYKDDLIEILKIEINSTDLYFITSDDIDTIDLTNIDLSLLERVGARYTVPYFKAEGGFNTTPIYKPHFKDVPFMPDVREGLGFDSSFQKAIFEFDKNGVKGEAISGMMGVESAPYFDLLVNIDKPFYYISTFQDTPLFVGKIVTL